MRNATRRAFITSALVATLAIPLAGTANAAPATEPPVPQAATVDQSQPQYLPGERRVDTTKADFDSRWNKLQAAVDARKAAGLAPLAVDTTSDYADYAAQVADASSTTTRWSESATALCSDPWGSLTSLAVAWDHVLVHNSTGDHAYVQPHAGSGWSVARVGSSHGSRYIHEMDFFGETKLVYFSQQQDPGGGSGSIPAGGSRVFNNAQGSSTIHNGRLGTSLWWTAINILRAGTAPDWFRAIISQGADAWVIAFYNNTSTSRTNIHQVGQSLNDGTRQECG